MHRCIIFNDHLYLALLLVVDVQFLTGRNAGESVKPPQHESGVAAWSLVDRSV